VALAVVLVGSAAEAASAGGDEGLAGSLAGWAQEVCGAASVSVDWLGIEDAWPAAEGHTFQWSGQPCRAKPTLRLTVLREGQLVASRGVRPGLTVMVPAPVAASRAAAGEPVVAEMGVAEIGDLRGAALAPGTWRARRDVEAGDPITTAVAEAMPDALSGSAVTVITRRGILTVSAPGRLLEDGELGRSVRVVNDATKVAMRGVLAAPDVVEVK